MTVAEEQSDLMKNILGLSHKPVGVKFHKDLPAEIEQAGDFRACQAVMEARRGRRIFITRENISCPAAAAALGLRLLPKNLQDGSMLCGYGIFKDNSSAIRVMENMPRLEANKFRAFEFKPLAAFSETPDIVTVEDDVEKLMWLALAYLNDGGGRLDFSTSILQAVCADAIVLPHLSQRINMSYGCYGCRDATDVRAGEAVLGFPGTMLDMVVANLQYLDRQAIHRSRAKNVFKAYSKRAVRLNDAVKSATAKQPGP